MGAAVISAITIGTMGDSVGSSVVGVTIGAFDGSGVYTIGSTGASVGATTGALDGSGVSSIGQGVGSSVGRG